jgi:two-component system OmpR family response regulator
VGDRASTGDNLRHQIDVLLVAAPFGDIDQLGDALEARGHAVMRADTPETVAHEVVRARPDVVMVDLREELKFGERLLSWVCRNSNAAAIAVTDLSQGEERIRALHLGIADDLVAPFTVQEGLARCELLIAQRRVGRATTLESGDIAIDTAQRTVTRNGDTITLTPRELAVLVVLVQRRGQPVSKRDLLADVWTGETRSENVVEANVSSLRRKLHASGPAIIHTLHGSGYVFRPVSSSLSVTRASLVVERGRIVPERDQIIARRDEIIRRLRSELRDLSSQ